MGPKTREILTHVASGGSVDAMPWVDGLRPLLHRCVKAALDFARAAREAHPPPADKEAADLDEFDEDSAYALDELEQLAKPPFTLQRIAEVLLSPLQFNVKQQMDTANVALDFTPGATRNKQMAALRSDKLQDSLRKCILVAPLGIA